MTAAHSPPPPPPAANSCYHLSPQRTPTNTNNNNYASTNTPILSAKRPKKWSTSPKSTMNAATTNKTNNNNNNNNNTPVSTTTTTALTYYSPKTPELAGKMSKKSLHSTTLSPMHNVRPVPRDSHHAVPSYAIDHKYYSSSSAMVASNGTARTTTTTTAAVVNYSDNGTPPHVKHPLTRIEETMVVVSHSENNDNDEAMITDSPHDNIIDNEDEGRGGSDATIQDDDTVESIVRNNSSSTSHHNNHNIGSSSSGSWVGRKVDAIFSPVLSFLSGTTSSTKDRNMTTVIGGVAPTSDHEAEECDIDDDDDVGTYIPRCPTTQSSNLDEPSESYIMHDEDEENKDGICNRNHFDNNHSTTKVSAVSASGRGSRSNSPCDTNNMTEVDIDGDVSMADDNCKLQHTLHHGHNEDDNYKNGTILFHDEESPPTPSTMDKKYEPCYENDGKNCLSSSSSLQKDEEQGYVDNDNKEEEDDLDDDEEEFNPYLFIKCLPPYHYAIPPGWISRPKALPPLDSTSNPPIPPICLVLDLDETLVHCTVEAVPDADMKFPVEFHGVEYLVHVRCRPYLREFLEAVADKFEVVIFTASQQVYADKLLDRIDPDGKFIRHRMFRDSCLPVEGNFLKDLTVLGRDLSKAVLVDNSPHAFGYQVDNGIPIESWFDDPTDKELLKLELFLRTLHGVSDVREVVRKTFQTHRLVLDA